MNHEKTFLSIVFGLVILLISACSDRPAKMPNTAKSTPEPIPTKIPGSTKSPSPTNMPTFTPTPLPTNTSTSTNTPAPTATPAVLPEGVELVNLRTSDGIDLVGYLHLSEIPSEKDLVVLLAHGHTQSHVEWADFEGLLIENGFSTMTFDFRGHGASSGTDQLATIGLDVETVIDFLKTEGFERIACIGSSMGGMGCLAASITKKIDGLVLLSSPRNPLEGPQLVSKSDLQNLKIPKIIMVAEEDIWGGTGLVPAIYEMAEIAGDPKFFYTYPGYAHGTGLFYAEYGKEVLDILLDFLITLSK